MVTIVVIHCMQSLQFSSVSIITTMKHLEKYMTEPLSLDYQLNLKSSGLTGRISFTMPTMHGIYQLMIFPDNLQKQRKKFNPRIKTTDPEKLFPEAGGRRVSRSSVFGRIHKCLF